MVPQAVRDAAGVPQQAAEVSVGAAVPRPEAAVPAGAGVAALRPEVAARAGAEVARQQEAAARAGVAEAARQQEAAPGVPAVRRPAVLPSAVPWVFRRDQPLPWPAPRPAARFAHANERRRIALP
jgi:hypothetical protein